MVSSLMMLFSRAPFEYTRRWRHREYRMPHTLSYHKNAWREIAWMRPMIIVHLASTHRLHSFFECHHKQNRTKPCYRVVPKANNAMQSPSN